jgi:riboflavin synthase
MFTGLIEARGRITSIEMAGDGCALMVREPWLAPQLAIGESVAVNGACLTVVAKDADSFRFECGPETLAKTNLGSLRVADHVNLERALRVGDRLGGHFVTGHVDGVGTIAERRPQGDFEMIWFTAPPDLCRQMVFKGCIAVDGISLTLVDVQVDRFSVMLIPHTLKVTTLSGKALGSQVNLETDLLAKYVSKQIIAECRSEVGK